MRVSIIALFLLLVQRVSLAHVPGSEQSLLERVGHQFTGLHHLPFLVLLAVLAILVTRHYLTRRSSNVK